MAHNTASIRARTSTREGFHHWKAQRLTAMSNVILVLWFVWSLAGLADSGYRGTIDWLSSPFNATLMVLLVGSSFYHAQLGLQVVIEDYVHDPKLKSAALICVNFAAIALATACVISILKVLIGS